MGNHSCRGAPEEDVPVHVPVVEHAVAVVQQLPCHPPAQHNQLCRGALSWGPSHYHQAIRGGAACEGDSTSRMQILWQMLTTAPTLLLLGRGCSRLPSTS